MRALSLLPILCVFISFPVLAEEAKKNEEEKVADTPITQWMAAESEVVEALDNQDKESYFIMRNKYGLIRAIRVVKQDVGNAVQECGQANPDMQDNMNARFDAWTDSVDPILIKADAFLKQEIKEQTIVEGRVLRKMLDLNDEAYDFQQAAIEKTVITTPEACQGLLESMDNSEEDMLRLMRGILLPTQIIHTSPKN